MTDFPKINLSLYVFNNHFVLKVIPHSGRTGLKEKNGKLKLHLKAPPEKNKANLELVKFFKKEYGWVVEIRSGTASREKVLKVVR